LAIATASLPAWWSSTTMVCGAALICSHLADSVEKQLVGQAPLEIPKSSRAADNWLTA